MFKRRRLISLGLALAICTGGLLAGTVVTVLTISLSSARDNIFELMGLRATGTIRSSIGRIEAQLKPASEQIETLGGQIETGRLSVSDEKQMKDVLAGSLSAAWQLKAVIFVGADLWTLGAKRDKQQITRFSTDATADGQLRDALAAGLKNRKAKWGAPIWLDSIGTTALTYRYPVWRGNEYLGMFIAAISINDLSLYLASADSSMTTNEFILYGKKHVLAHPFMADTRPDMTPKTPLPRLAGFTDPILASVWDSHEKLPIPLPSPIEGYIVHTLNDSYVFFLCPHNVFGEKNWWIGNYYRLEEVANPLNQLVYAAAIGLATLLLSVVVAVFVTRRVARPMNRIAAQARAIGALELDKVEEVGGSRIREIDEQAQAFNTMLRGLKWFEIYAPRNLVSRIMAQGEDILVSREEEVTIMFTDLVGFTNIAENLPAEVLAGMLNGHFELLGKEVEATGGSIDKFIGDCMMAFWGAPDPMKDHAQQAFHAALRIAEVVAADNDRRELDGNPRLRVRIGLHTGRVIVGNIGAPGRMDYTIVGDTVNVAERLESVGHDYEAESDDVIIIISSDTAARLDDADRARLEPTGEVELRGRQKREQVFKVRAAE